MISVENPVLLLLLFLLTPQKLAGESGEQKRTFHQPRAEARKTCSTCNAQGQKKGKSDTYLERSKQLQLALETEG